MPAGYCLMRASRALIEDSHAEDGKNCTVPWPAAKPDQRHDVGLQTLSTLNCTRCGDGMVMVTRASVAAVMTTPNAAMVLSLTMGIAYS